MRIALDVGEGVMLSMDRNPLARTNAGRQPQHEPEHVADRGRQGQRAMRESPMKVDRRAEIGEQREPQTNASTEQKCAHFETVAALPTGR